VSDLYGEEYYRCHCGPTPLDRTPQWLERAGEIADHLIRSLKPRRVLDAGCATGLLVESLWDRGVEAAGIDISEYAISQVRADLRDCCHVESICDPIAGRFDVVTCIEVLEHLEEADALKAIENLSAVTDSILFSSDPYDFNEPTHVNVRPLLYWLHAFAAVDFHPDLTYDAGFVAPHAMLFRKSADSPSKNDDVLQAYTELIRHKIILAKTVRRCAESEKAVEALTAARNASESQLQEREHALEETRAGFCADLRRVEADLCQLSARTSRQDLELAAVTEQAADLTAFTQEQLTKQAADLTAFTQEQVSKQVGDLTSLGQGLDQRISDLTAFAQVYVHDHADQLRTLDRRLQAIYDSRIWRAFVAGGRLLLSVAHPFAKEPKGLSVPVDAVPAKEVQEQYQVCFDERFSGAIISRQESALIHGWVIAKSGVRALELTVDDTINVPTEYGRRRPDVLAAHPAYAQADNSGFTATLDTAGLGDGAHSLVLRIHTTIGNILTECHQFTLSSQSPYDIWTTCHALSPVMLEDMKEEALKFSRQPLISIVTPLYKTSLSFLSACAQSVFDQVYQNWQLCLVDDGSGDPVLTRRAEEFQQRDSRVVFRGLPSNSGIAVATNECLKLATGEFIAFLDHDDELSPNALYEVVKRLNAEPGLDVLYSDEDKITTDNQRYDYFFKPDWSPELFLSTNYVCHFLVVRRRLIEEVGGIRCGFEGSQDYDLMLRVTELTDKVRRIPKVLYHWRSHPQSTASATDQKPTASLAGYKALTEHLERRRQDAEVVELGPGRYRVKYRVRGTPEIGIVIPAGGNRLVREAVHSVLKKSTYKKFSIVVVDNTRDGTVSALLGERVQRDRRVTILDRAGAPFNFSALCNAGATACAGQYLLFLNDDTLVMNPDWLEALLEHAQRDEVGAVGALLLFPDQRIQHAGVVLGVYGVAGHAFRLLASDQHHYFMFPALTRNCSAVTGACLMTRREVFDEVGGFDEENLPTCFQDVDYCLRLVAKHYRIVYTPYAKLLHYESATKTSIANRSEIEYMRKRWHEYISDDPYYNPNLSRRREDFSVNLDGATAP
jgi:GT2 family glycosyltransferase/SAM-dependent methyltransferase